jgi:hypothetical protein
MLVANVPTPAPAPAPNAPGKQPEVGDILIPALWLAGALLLLALIYKIVTMIWDRQVRRAVTDDSIHGQLAHFRQAFERGEMSEAEYNRVHKLLTGRVRQEAGLPPKQPTGETPSAETAAPPPLPRDTGSGDGQVTSNS